MGMAYLRRQPAASSQQEGDGPTTRRDARHLSSRALSASLVLPIPSLFVNSIYFISAVLPGACQCPMEISFVGL